VSAISKPETKTAKVAERQIASARSALLRAIQTTAEEIRAVKNNFQAWVLRTGAIWAPRHSPPAPEPHPPVSFPCPHCSLTLRLKGKGPQVVIYDIVDWERQCQHRHLGSPQLCQLLSLGQSGLVH
jgi:hypothetical protein